MSRSDDIAGPVAEPPVQRAAEDDRALQHYDRFFELSFDLLCIASFDGYFKLLSPSWAKTLGFSLEELQERPFIDFVHPDDRQDTIDEAAKIAEGGITISFDNRYRTKSGEYRWLYWSAVPDHEHGVILAVARDITERKRVGKELEEAKESAEAANRAKSDFLAQMSHELRTPLNSVIGFADVLLSGKPGELAPIQKDYLARIRANGEHLLGLINQVLDLSKVESGRAELDLESVDLGVLVQSVVHLLEPEVEGRPIDLVVQVPERLNTISSDRQKLKQVLINLVGNAVKFTEEGRVVVRVETDPSSADPIRLIVEDTGIGIPEEAHESVFETFEQVDHGTSRSFEGTGLGLAIAESLCELLGYGLNLESRVNEGSTFSIDLEPREEGRLPAAASEQQQDEARSLQSRAAPRSEEITFSDKLVLVVDDDRDSRMLLTHALHELGCQVLTASSGSQGMRLALSHQPDLITLDLLMPEVNGWDLLGSLRAEPKLADVPVVVVSASDKEDGRLESGVLEVLEKPVHQASFRKAVVRALADFKGRVLVVDDSEDDRRLLRAYLEETGAEVVTEASGSDALRRLESYLPDLVVVDLMMPAMSGPEFVARLREKDELSELPVILVTAKDLDGAEVEALSRDSAMLLSKGPALKPELETFCRRIWNRPISVTSEAPR